MLWEIQDCCVYFPSSHFRVFPVRSNFSSIIIAVWRTTRRKDFKYELKSFVDLFGATEESLRWTKWGFTPLRGIYQLDINKILIILIMILTLLNTIHHEVICARSPLNSFFFHWNKDQNLFWSFWVMTGISRPQFQGGQHFADSSCGDTLTKSSSGDGISFFYEIINVFR